MTTTSGTVAPGVDAAQLYERYGGQIYRYCLGRLRNREEAADAVQNTFLRVHVALGKGVVPQYEASWLYKIAHNVCLTWIESSGRRALVETPRDLDSLDESLLAAPASEHEAVEQFAEALAALPHNLRQAILLREWQGLSYTEIAAAMDTTVSAVETLLVRARRQMAAMLERSGTRLRNTAAALLDVLGLRGLLSEGMDKVAAGAALVAVGGSGIGAAVALSSSPASPPPRPAPSIARPVVAVLPSRPSAPARVSLQRAVVQRATHRVSTPAPRLPDGSSPSSTAVEPVSEAAPRSPAAPAPGDVALPSPPETPSVSTAALPTLPPSPVDETTIASQLPVTAPQLPVTAAALTVPTATIP